MGLATIDPHSLKEHTEIYKIPKFGVNRPNSMACRTAVRHAIHFFVNFNIFKWLYLAYYWDNFLSLFTEWFSSYFLIA